MDKDIRTYPTLILAVARGWVINGSNTGATSPAVNEKENNRRGAWMPFIALLRKRPRLPSLLFLIRARALRRPPRPRASCSRPPTSFSSFPLPSAPRSLLALSEYLNLFHFAIERAQAPRPHLPPSPLQTPSPSPHPPPQCPTASTTLSTRRPASGRWRPWRSPPRSD